MKNCLIRIRTANVRKAGTDSKIFITLFGSQRQTRRRLNDKKNNFERGMDEHFLVQIPRIGSIQQIKVESDGSGRSPGLKVRDVTVRVAGDSNIYRFTFNAWLSKKEGLSKTKAATSAVNGADPGVLAVKWAAFIDNAEGSSGDRFGITGHGPIGNLHLMVYEPRDFSALLAKPHRTSYPAPLRHMILTGPTSKKMEWDDGDVMRYGSRGADLWRWRRTNDEVCIFVWESDPDGPVVSRRHDAVFLALVSRSRTLTNRVFASPASRSKEFSAKNTAVSRAQVRGGTRLLTELRQKGAWNRGYEFNNRMPRGFLELQTIASPNVFLPPRSRSKGRQFGPI